MGRVGRVWVGLVAIVVALASAPSAHAVSTCAFDDPSDTVTITMSQSADTARLDVVGGQIQLTGSGGNPCPAGATVTSTDTINVNETTPGGGAASFTIAQPVDFAPGVTVEAGLSEIEFNVNLGSDTLDSFSVLGTSGVDAWRMGSSGAAPDIDFNADNDSELAIVTGIDNWNLVGLAGADALSAQGFGSVTAFTGPAPLTMQGREDNDILEGGDDPDGDMLLGEAGDDTLRGFGGNDSLTPGIGNHTIEGGAGDQDVANYSAGGPVSVDLGTTQPQATGQGTDTLVDVEDLTGSSANDTLLGSAGANRLFGVGGDDVLDGRGGSDLLNGGSEFLGGTGSDTITYAGAPAGVAVDLTAGQTTGGFGTDTLSQVENVIGSPFADTLTGSAAGNSITALAGTDTVSALAAADAVDVRDGEADTASCGSEIDTAIADRQSVDTVNADCENTSFLAEPAMDPGGGGDGGGDGGGGNAADTELLFELRGRRAQDLVRQKGVVVKGLCPNEDCSATVTGAVKLPRPDRTRNSRAKFSLKPVTKALPSGEPTKFKLRLKRKRRAAVAAALAKDTKVKARVAASVSDAAGNLVSAKRKVRAKD